MGVHCIMEGESAHPIGLRQCPPLMTAQAGQFAGTYIYCPSSGRFLLRVATRLGLVILLLRFVMG